jgi:osmotically-inducible protein OsmY
VSANDDMLTDVTEELAWDPKVDSRAVAVSAQDGTVTLRGTVGSVREKREAARVAARVFGVVAVKNELQVRLLDEAKRSDAELRRDVLQALMLNSAVPATVDAKVDDGFVTLTGTAEWQFQRDEADLIASNTVGALDVFDEIVVVHPQPDAASIKESMKRAFVRNASIDGHRLSITSSDGTVTIEGTVSSAAERDAAIATAWATKGVKHVEDRVSVEYQAP